LALVRWQPTSANPGRPVADPPAELFADLPVTDEEMIGIWQRVLNLLPRRDRITLGVIAATRGEGVSTLVRGLARVVVKNPSTRVLICEIFARDENVTRGPGVTSPSVVDLVFVEDRIERSNTVQWLADHRLALGSLGDASWLNSVSTDPDSVRAIVAALSSQFELVLLDLPPVSQSIACPAFARELDGVLLVVEAERTPAAAVRAARDALNIYGTKVLGVVLNKRRQHVQGLVRRGIELVKWPR
jgi:succinoglycan biosynthesis transport protein ExoP